MKNRVNKSDNHDDEKKKRKRRRRRKGQNPTESPKKRPQKKEKTKKSKLGNLRSIFRKAVLASIIAHAPIIGGAFQEHENQYNGPIGFIDYGAGRGSGKGGESPSYESIVEEAKEEVIEQRHLTPEEANDSLKDISPEAHVGFKQAQEAIKERQAAREKNIDPERVKAHKAEIRRKLENGEKILFSEFAFEVEEIAMGVPHDVIEEGKATFMQEMAELEAKKPPKPTRAFLNEVVQYTESGELQEAYDVTRTSIADYLTRKGKGSRGNCQARGKYGVMALEHLYPEYWDDNVAMQQNGKHVRGLFTIEDETYMLEPGVRLVTEANKRGTIIFHPRKIMEIYAEMDVDPVAVEGELTKEEKNKKAKGLPIVTDNTAFPYPEADGQLIGSNDDMSHLYEKKRLIPQETRNRFKPPIPPQQEARIQGQGGQGGAGGASPKPEEKKQMESPEMTFHVVKDEQGNTTEVLPWEPDVYSDQELVDRVRANKFFASDYYKHNPAGGLANHIGPMLNPSAKSLKAVNEMQVDELIFGDVSNYGQAALKEIFKTPARRVEFQLDHPHIPMTLRAALQSQEYADFSKDLKLSINRDLFKKPHFEKEDQGLSKEEMEMIIPGTGGLELYYHQRKNYSPEEIKMIARSGRPYVILNGSQCYFGYEEALKHMEGSETTLVISDERYIELLLQDSSILLKKNISTMAEYFPAINSLYNQRRVSEYTMLNAYLLNERGFENLSDEQKTKAKSRLEGILYLLEQKMRRQDPTNAESSIQSMRSKAEMKAQNNDEKAFPFPEACMGICTIPETDQEAAELGVERTKTIQVAGKNMEIGWRARRHVEVKFEGETYYLDYRQGYKEINHIKVMPDNSTVGVIIKIHFINRNDIVVREDNRSGQSEQIIKEPNAETQSSQGTSGPIPFGPNVLRPNNSGTTITIRPEDSKDDTQ